MCTGICCDKLFMHPDLRFKATIASLNFGFTSSWNSPYVLKIPEDKAHYDISEEEASYLTIISPCSSILTCVLFSKLNDWIGRKATLMLISIPYAIFGILTIIASDIVVFYIARSFAGLGDTFFIVTLPMYVGEISTPRVRGSWGNLIMIQMFLGMFCINIVGSYFTVKQTGYICLALSLLYFLLMLPLPESPYFHLMKGQEDKAKKSLMFLRGKTKVEDEYKTLKLDVERQISESGEWMDILKIPTNRRALFAGLFLRFSHQMTGTMVFNTLAQFVFEKAGTSISSELSSIIYSGLLLLFTIFCVCSAEKIGRKKNYLYSLLTTGIVLTSLTVYFFLEENNIADVSKVRWYPLLGMILYLISTSFGVTFIPALMLGELFSASVKPKALTLISISTSLTIFVTNKVFFVLYSNFGLSAPFLMFTIGCFISALLSTKILPETKGKSLEEIQKMLMNT